MRFLRAKRVAAIARPMPARRGSIFFSGWAAAAAAQSLPGHARAQGAGAVAAPVRVVEVGGRKLAYRTVGKGNPIVLCHRFRGVLDLWDPAFIDGLAAEGFEVVTFDYSGLGQSIGEKTYNPAPLAQDAKDLIDALGLKDVVIGGWSIGGIAAQIFLAMFGAHVSHVVLLATTPPGKLVKTAEQLFYDTAAQPGITLEQFTTIFFEPKDEGSRAASKRSFDRIFARKTADAIREYTPCHHSRRSFAAVSLAVTNSELRVHGLSVRSR